MRTSARGSCTLTLHRFFNVIKHHRKAFKPLAEKKKSGHNRLGLRPLMV